MNKKVLSIIGAVVLLGIVGVLKFVVQPWLELKQKQSTGDWTESRSELKAQFKELTKNLFSDMDVPADAMNQVEDCIVDKAIPFLNQSGCKYHYVKTTTSEADHIKEQEKCLEKVGWEKKLELITVECIREKIPNDWKIAKTALIRDMMQGFTAQVPDENKRKQAAECTSDMMIKELQASDCPIITKDGKVFDALFNNAAECIKKNPVMQKKVNEGVQRCLGIEPG